MKLLNKTILLFVALASVVCCNKPEPDNGGDKPSEPKEVEKTFTASAENIITKAAVSSEGVITFSENDEISVFDGKAVRKLTSSAPGKFKGTVLESDTYCALYPYAEGASVGDGTFDVAIPARQTISGGAVADGANIAVAMTDDEILSFKNVGAYIALKVHDPAISSITIASKSSEEPLAGSARTSYNDGEPSSTVTSGQSVITLDGAIENGQTYYAVAFPTKASSITVTVTTAEGHFASRTMENVTLSRNNALAFDLAFQDSDWDMEVTDGQSYVFSSRDELLEFTAISPSRKENVADLTISGDDITSEDLARLVNRIASVTGTLTLDGIAATSLDGFLDVIPCTGSIIIINCPNLTDLSALETYETIGGDLIIRDNRQLCTLAGIKNLVCIKGNVVILDNGDIPVISNDTAVGFCLIREFFDNGVIGTNASITLGTTASPIDFATLSGCTITDPDNPNNYPSYILNGSGEVEAFISGRGSQRESVFNLTVTGGDVTNPQLLQLKDRVEYVYGTFCLDGTADVAKVGDESWLQLDQIFYASNNSNGIHIEGSIILQNLNCPINPNGFQGLTEVKGDVTLRDIENFPMSNGWNPFNALATIDGNLTLERLKSSLGNFNFSALKYVGGSLTINDCDNGFWDISGTPAGLIVEGDLVLTGNGVAFTYADWRTGFYNFKKIGGNVIILDNAIDNKAREYCFVRDLMDAGVISPTSFISIGMSSSPVDLSDVKSCNSDNDTVDGGNEGYDDRIIITE